MNISGRTAVGAGILVCALAFWGASRVLGPINAMRAELQLTWTSDIAQNLPPNLALTQAALGTFRGVAVNVLWQRATRLKEEGKFYEAMQLSDWITTLQPRFPHVWEFNAWNMAYNISVATHTPEERWMWVDAGVRLLRDRGIPNNPHSLRLYRMLGWILLHKMGGITDDMNWYYKLRFAEEWHAIVGAPPRGRLEAYLDWVRGFAEAPATVQELVAGRPELGPVIAQLDQKGHQLDERLLRALTQEEARRQLAAILRAEAVPAEFAAEARILPADLADAALAELIAFIRARTLLDRYHMEPAVMLELAQRFGPFDWRLPASHAVYWGYLGLALTEPRLEKAGTPDAETVNSDRLVFHGLQQLTHQGRLIFDPVSGYYALLPEPRFLDAFEAAYLTVAAKRGEAAMENFAAGHRNLLEWGVRLAYFYGDPELAYDVYGRLRDQYGDPSNPDDKYVQPLDEFVMAEFQELAGSQNDARQFISGQLYQMIAEGFANDDPQLAERFYDSARRMHEWYARAQAGSATARQRLGLPPLEDMAADALTQYLQEPAEETPILMKVRVWRNAPLPLQRKVFARVRDQLYGECEQSELDAVAAFPIPPDLSWPTPAERQRPPGTVASEPARR